MNSFPKDKESRLLALLRQELELFQRIREITGKQTEMLADEDIEAFDESLDSRQALIEEINGLHQESDILMQSYLSFSGSAGGQKIGAIEEVAGQLRGVIEECTELDSKNMALSKEKAEEFVKQIGKLSQGRKGLGAYIHNVSQNSELFDKKM